MKIRAALYNTGHIEYGLVTIPFPIPADQYDSTIQMLEALDIGNPRARDCTVEKLQGPVPILKRLEGSKVNVDELDYLVKRLDSFADNELAQFQGMAYIKGILEPRIGETALPDLTGLRLQKLYQELRENGKIRLQGDTDPGLSPKTIRGIHTMLHNALGQAVKEGLILKNPTDDCRPPRVDRKEMKVIKPEQVGSYLQAAAARNVLPMFFLELTSGIRKGERLALLWSDLDVEKRSISVTKSVSRRDGVLEVSPPKTRHSIRNIIIPQQAVDLLIQEHSLHPNNPYMFPSPVTGEMYCPDTINHLHKKLLKDAGLEDCRFHDLRHTFATLALQNGVDVKTLSGILGHYSSGFTLDTYTHVTTKMQEEAAEKMGHFMEMKL